MFESRRRLSLKATFLTQLMLASAVLFCICFYMFLPFVTYLLGYYTNNQRQRRIWFLDVSTSNSNFGLLLYVLWLLVYGVFGGPFFAVWVCFNEKRLRRVTNSKSLQLGPSLRRRRQATSR